MGSKHGWSIGSFATRTLGTLTISALLGSSGCASDMGEISKLDDVGVVQAAVENGTVQTGEAAGPYSGIVRIWARNSQFDEMRQFCTGVLITNKLVATARHCLDSPEAVAYGFPDVSSDTSALTVSTNLLSMNAQGIGAPMYAPDGRDLVVFRLETGLPVKSRGEVMYSGFVRNLGGTPESNVTLATCGYGEVRRGVTSEICQYVSKETNLRIRGCIDDPFEFNLGVGTPLSNPPKEILNIGVHSSPGDSGGATVVLDGSSDFADFPLVGINALASRCVDTPEGTVCGAVSARTDDLKTWLGAIGNF